MSYHRNMRLANSPKACRSPLGAGTISTEGTAQSSAAPYTQPEMTLLSTLLSFWTHGTKMTCRSAVSITPPSNSLMACCLGQGSNWSDQKHQASASLTAFITRDQRQHFAISHSFVNSTLNFFLKNYLVMFQASLWPFLRNRLEKRCTGAEQESQLLKKTSSQLFPQCYLNQTAFC